MFKVFSSMNTAQTNEVEHHVCDICLKSYKSKSYLTVHKRTHSSKRLYNCDVCDKSFPWKSSLERHQLTHSGLKIYQCDVYKKMLFTENPFKTACNSSH